MKGITYNEIYMEVSEEGVIIFTLDSGVKYLQVK
jgi:hypothetical protein